MQPLSKNRLETFSDGVIAIIITIMVLELRPPHQATLSILKTLLPTFFSYILSYIYIAIYWNNHHHMLHAASSINGKVMWANFHLLFWLSLFPFVTAWVGTTHGASLPTALYGFVFMMASIAYAILQISILALEGKKSGFGRAFRTTWKEKISPLCYLAAIVFAFVSPWISNALYIYVALIWIIPDQRIEKLAEQK
jgi:uncharacterized membrane protein